MLLWQLPKQFYIDFIRHQRALGTAVAEGVEEGGGVREAGAVWVVVDRPHPGLVSATVLSWDVDGVTDAAVGQPTGITLVKTSLPSQVELPDGGQLGSQRVAVGGGGGQAQFLWHRGVEHFTWRWRRF